MKTRPAQTRSVALLLTALLAAPLAFSPALGEPVQPGVSVPADAPALDLNRSDAVNLRLQTRAVTDAIERAAYTQRDPVITYARRGSEEGRTIAATLGAAARMLRDGVRQDVEKALERAELARQRLNGVISLASDSAEARWNDLRNSLSERYEQYATALEEARKEAVDGGAHFESQPEASAATPKTAPSP